MISSFFFFNDTATTEIYTLSLHDALPISTVTAERFLARKRESWEAFRTLAARMERSGVGALAAGEIPPFAARYRQMAGELARGHTYRVGHPGIGNLERAWDAGHNAS